MTSLWFESENHCKPLIENLYPALSNNDKDYGGPLAFLKVETKQRVPYSSGIDARN